MWKPAARAHIGWYEQEHLGCTHCAMGNTFCLQTVHVGPTKHFDSPVTSTTAVTLPSSSIRSLRQIPGSHCAQLTCAHCPHVVGRRKPPSTGHMQQKGLSDCTPPVSSQTVQSQPTSGSTVSA
eukprot:9472051-Pyramimonas_sp.AAC.4